MTKERFINDAEENFLKILAEYQDTENKYVLRCFNKLSYRMLNYILAVRKSDYGMEFYFSASYAMNYICNNIVEAEYNNACKDVSLGSGYIFAEASDGKRALSDIRIGMSELFVNYKVLKDEIEELKKVDRNEQLKDVYIDELKMDDNQVWLNEYSCTKKSIEDLELLIGPQSEFDKLLRNNFSRASSPAVNEESSDKQSKIIDQRDEFLLSNIDFCSKWVGHNMLSFEDLQVLVALAGNDNCKVERAIEYVDEYRKNNEVNNYLGVIIKYIEKN